MAVRQRTIKQFMNGGILTRPMDPTPTNDPIQVGWEVCEDDTGYGDCHNFTVTRRKVYGPMVINKSRHPVFDDIYYLVDFVPDAIRGFNYGHPYVPGLPDDWILAAQAAARTNPSRPYVDLPVSLAELREIPDLIRGFGNNLLQRVANANLRYQFGLAPLASDLAKMTRLLTTVEKRLEEIKRLFGKKGLRRTVSMGEWSTSGTFGTQLHSRGADIYVQAPYRSLVQKRVHCRWLPTVAIPNNLGVPQWVLDRLHGAMLGMTGRAWNSTKTSQLWNALPWSWLIDWFTNIGDLLEAQRNHVPAALDTLCVMTHTQTVIFFPPLAYDNISFSGGGLELEEKRRQRLSLAPAAHLPFLSANQVGLLGSIVASKRGR